MSHDPEVTARIDHLLRTDPRLSAAAPLIGRVPAVVTDPKPPRERRKAKAKKRPPPNLVEQAIARAVERGDLVPVEDDEEDDDETPAKPTGLPPWLKVAQAKVVSPKMRAALGAEALAYVEVDGWLWGQLTPELRDAALILTIRGLRWEERESDGADLVKRERAPLQCHPDTVHELSELVAALTEDPAEAAAGSDAAESLDWERAREFAQFEEDHLGVVVERGEEWKAKHAAARVKVRRLLASPDPAVTIDALRALLFEMSDALNGALPAGVGWPDGLETRVSEALATNEVCA